MDFHCHLSVRECFWNSPQIDNIPSFWRYVIRVSSLSEFCLFNLWDKNEKRIHFSNDFILRIPATKNTSKYILRCSLPSKQQAFVFVGGSHINLHSHCYCEGEHLNMYMYLYVYIVYIYIIVLYIYIYWLWYTPFKLLFLSLPHVFCFSKNRQLGNQPLVSRCFVWGLSHGLLPWQGGLAMTRPAPRAPEASSRPWQFTMGNSPFEDVSPIKNGGFPLLC